MKITAGTSMVFFIVLLFFSQCQIFQEDRGNIVENLNFAEKQIGLLLEQAYKADMIPRTVSNQGSIQWTNEDFDWTEGFFPGTCWYLYEYTKDPKWKDAAVHFQNKFQDHRSLPYYHDLGFVFNCSYGNGYRLTGNQAFRDILVEAGNTLVGRFNPKVGCMRSWDVDKGWQSKRDWEFPVIIDNMMNLELLFELSLMTGDQRYKEVAVTHANTTLRNHFRDDMSSYHVIDYDSITGDIRHRHTAQGFAHESSWARGQAWGLYGFTICYRYTKDEKYLRQAEGIASYILDHPVTPADRIPYWDYDAAKIPDEPRDASAAAITASALVELDGYSDVDYLSSALDIIQSLSSSAYSAELGENSNFVLKHNVGSIPHQNEIDVPLIYADYYYVEALLRLKEQMDPELNLSKVSESIN